MTCGRPGPDGAVEQCFTLSQWRTVKGSMQRQLAGLLFCESSLSQIEHTAYSALLILKCSLEQSFAVVPLSTILHSNRHPAMPESGTTCSANEATKSIPLSDTPSSSFNGMRSRSGGPASFQAGSDMGAATPDQNPNTVFTTYLEPHLHNDAQVSEQLPVPAAMHILPSQPIVPQPHCSANPKNMREIPPQTFQAPLQLAPPIYGWPPSHDRVDASYVLQNDCSQVSVDPPCSVSASFEAHEQDVRRTFGSVRDGRLREAGGTLISMANWLVNNAEHLGS